MGTVATTPGRLPDRQSPDEVGRSVRLDRQACILILPLPTRAQRGRNRRRRGASSRRLRIPVRGEVSRSSATRTRSGAGRRLTTTAPPRRVADERDTMIFSTSSSANRSRVLEESGTTTGRRQDPTSRPSVISAMETGRPSSSDNVAMTSGRCNALTVDVDVMYSFRYRTTWPPTTGTMVEAAGSAEGSIVDTGPGDNLPRSTRSPPDDSDASDPARMADRATRRS